MDTINKEKKILKHQDFANSQSLTIVSELGRGCQGVVYLVNDQLGHKYALKILEKNDVEIDILNEKMILEKLQGIIGVVKLYRSFEDDRFMGFQMQLYKQDLEMMMEQKQYLSLYEITKFIRQLAITLYQIHKQGVVLFDLKPSNILIDDQLNPFIIDFGLASFVQNSKCTFTDGSCGYSFVSNLRIASLIDLEIEDKLGYHNDFASLGRIYLDLIIRCLNQEQVGYINLILFVLTRQYSSFKGNIKYQLEGEKVFQEVKQILFQLKYQQKQIYGLIMYIFEYRIDKNYEEINNQLDKILLNIPQQIQFQSISIEEDILKQSTPQRPSVEKDLIFDRDIQRIIKKQSKGFTLNNELFEISLSLLHTIYFTKENIIQYIEEFIESVQKTKSNEQSTGINVPLKNIKFQQYNQLLSETISLIQYLNGQQFQINSRHAIFFIQQQVFQNYKLKQQQLSQVLNDDLEFRKGIDKQLKNTDKFAFLTSIQNFPLFLLQQYYENFNIKILYSKQNIQNQIQNDILEHLLFSGMIGDTYYLKLIIKEDELLVYEDVIEQPNILREQLDKSGFNQHMIFNIEQGSIIASLYSPQKLSEDIKQVKQASYFSYLDGLALNMTQSISKQHNIYYSIHHQTMAQQYRGNIKTKEIADQNNEVIKKENQPHNFPVKYYGIGISIEKYGDNKKWLDQNEGDGVWMTLFHGTKPYNEGYTHINNIIKEGFQLSQNTLQITYHDAMSNYLCRFRQERIGPNNIYFTNSIRTEKDRYRNDNGGAEVYTKPIRINNNEYNIIFMCRGDPEQVYSPIEYPVQFMVKHNSYVRPYRILIMESIKNEEEITFIFVKNKKYITQTSYKHYLNESMKSLMYKLKNSMELSNKEEMVLCLNNQNHYKLFEEENLEQSFGEIIKLKNPKTKRIPDQQGEIVWKKDLMRNIGTQFFQRLIKRVDIQNIKYRSILQDKYQKKNKQFIKNSLKLIEYLVLQCYIKLLVKIRLDSLIKTSSPRSHSISQEKLIKRMQAKHIFREVEEDGCFLFLLTRKNKYLIKQIYFFFYVLMHIYLFADPFKNIFNMNFPSLQRLDRYQF